MRVQIYEWLVGDENSFIVVNGCKVNQIYNMKFTSNNLSSQKNGVAIGRVGNIVREGLELGFGAWYIRCYNGRELSRSLAGFITQTFDISPNGGCVVNGNKYGETYPNEPINPYETDLVLFAFDESLSSTRMMNGSISDVYIGDINNNPIAHLKPCKLLSPYQSHPAGECCMIDVLSNTLYFNQGSGAFSVEGEAGEVIDTTPVINNIISKESTKAVRLREWLINNGTNAYINTGIVVTPNTNAEIVHQRFEKKGGSTLMGARTDVNDRGRFVIWNEWQMNNDTKEALRVSLGYPIHDSVTYRPYELNKTYKMSIVGNSIYYDDELIDTVTERDNGTCPLYIFALNENNHALYTNGRLRIGKVTFSGDINKTFHPAELALPYENHPIGEACMIDLNSGELYFNKGSGSFTCEGAFLGYWQDKPMVNHYCDVSGTLHRSVQIFADNGERLRLIWEKSKPWTEHRWLVADGKANLPNFETKKINVMVKTDTITDKQFGWINSPYGSDAKCLSELRIRSDFFILYNWNVGKPRQIYVPINQIAHLTTDGGNIFNVNGVDYDVTSIATDFTGVEMLGFSLARTNVKAVNVHISALFTDTLHLTPVILDRPTLAEEDNNNIARKQGEAVFVDEQRYKQGLPWVFGNVASSGSFSVSDYLIEGEDYEKISGATNASSDNFVNLNIPTDETTPIVAKFVNKNTDNRPVLLLGGLRIWVNNGYLRLHRVNGTFSYNINLNDTSTDIDVYIYRNKLCVNGVDYQPDGLGIIDNISGIMSMSATAQPISFRGISKQGVIDLIPIRLLRNIEPTCTHNGKGGKVGEIGFFDTISGKFYGNDGTGEFTEYIP